MLVLLVRWSNECAHGKSASQFTRRKTISLYNNHHFLKIFIQALNFVQLDEIFPAMSPRPDSATPHGDIPVGVILRTGLVALREFRRIRTASQQNISPESDVMINSE